MIILFKIIAVLAMLLGFFGAIAPRIYDEPTALERIIFLSIAAAGLTYILIS